MTGQPLVYEAPLGVGLEELEDTLFDAFDSIRSALAEASPVVIVVREEELLGHGEAGDAALAGALVGLVRALAVEGVRENWRINALSVTADVAPEHVIEWTLRLADPAAANGELVRLGNLHLGRLPV